MANSIFTPIEGGIAGLPSESPSDPNFRYFGQPVDGEKTVAAALRARNNAFSTLEEFAAWRRSKGMPELDHTNLAWAWARYRGETPGETATLNPILETR
jgi:hypothetical protein